VFLGFDHAGANLCFAVGQVEYLLKSTPELESTPKHTIFWIVFYWCV
jgi:hypothetical protein